MASDNTYQAFAWYAEIRMAPYQSIFRSGLFASRTAIVTGAGSGIGRCTAHELAALGAGVALIGRKAEKLEAVAREIADMWNGMPGMGHSGAARAGMLNFTETAALEWAPVRVNAVAPGWIASSGLDHYPPEMREHIRALPNKVPLSRLGTESEISAAIVFLLSPAATFLTGSRIRLARAGPDLT